MKRHQTLEHARAGFLAGALEALTIVAGFVLAGATWAALEARARAPEPPYPRVLVEEQDRSDPGAEPAVWLIDGFNVLHAGVLRGRDRREWWTEPRREALLRVVAAFDEPADRVFVVFDGRRPPGEASAENVVFAPSADDWLLERVRAAPEPGRVVVVTGDRQLADRVRHRGARVVSPRQFLARCGA
jgi:predicted RNA-binding protein with PIN domain